MSATLLGFLDSKIKDEFKGDAWRTNKIGGHLCLSSKIKENELEDLKRLSICENCKKQMIFIGQIGCPLEFDNYDRFLIFYACDGEKCDKWSIIRYIQDADEYGKQEEKESVQIESNWLDEQNDWNDEVDLKDENLEDNLEGNLEDKEDKESNLNTNEINQFIIINEHSKDFIQPYYLDVDLENQTADSIKLDSHVEELIKQYKDKNENKDNEEFSKMEETDILENYNNDLQTYKFYKKLSLANGQVIRYSWNQSPLVNSSNLCLEEIKCDNCGSLKVFELQLMPALINYLRFKDKPLNIEFASVLVYTCKQNCSTKMLTQESFVVLNEVEQMIPDEILKL